MQKLHFSIEINAPKQKVWEVMLADATYREWTEVFHAGSYYEGGWEKGDKIKFLGPNEDGTTGGMLSEIADIRPYEFISINHLGMIMNGVEDTTSDMVKSWLPAHENYTFTENEGVTTLEIDLDTDDTMKGMFEEIWPKALKSLKSIAER